MKSKPLAGEGWRIYHSGDTSLFRDLKLLGKVEQISEDCLFYPGAQV